MRIGIWMVGLLAIAPAMMSQAVVSVKAGVVHYIEGEATIDGAAAETRLGGKFAELKEGQVFATAEGRAEILLTPGVVIRLGENSSMKMLSNRLVDTRVDLVSGVAIVEVSDGLNLKDTAVTVLVKEASVTLSKMALIRLDANSGVRVYKGEAQVLAGGTPTTLKDGRELQFGAGNLIAKFDAKQTDPLYRWANRRAEYIAMANISAARMVRTGDYSISSEGWFLNPYFGMFTYLPLGNSVFRTPFGYSYYSPARVARYYYGYAQRNAPVYAGNGGGRGPSWSNDHGYMVNSQRSAGPSYGSSGGYVNSGSAGAAPAASAPAADAPGRGADVSTGRGGASSNGH